MKNFLLTCLLLVIFATNFAAAQSWHSVAYDNAGVAGKQPHLIQGESWEYPADALPLSAVAKDDPARTVAFGDAVRFGYAGLVKDAKYKCKMTFLSDDAERKVKVLAGDTTLAKEISLAQGKKATHEFDLPAATYANGTLQLVVQKVAGPNAVVSEVTILASDAKKLGKTDPFAAMKKDVSKLVAELRPNYAPIPLGCTPINLGGTWSFWQTPPADFEKLAAPDGQAKKIEVPGEWVMQGLPVKRGTAAGYWREFEIPKEWAGQQFRLRFDAVYSECTVWVNGKKVGGHLGGFTPFEIDITDVAEVGKNRLALSVTSDSLADKLASGMKYAAHDLGGINRKVTLFAVPQTYINSLHVVGGLSDDLKDGTAEVQLSVAQPTAAKTENLTAEITLRPWKKDEPAFTQKVDIPKMKETACTEQVAKIAVPSPELWHPEHPNLYVATVVLQLGGKTLETVERRFGFKKTEVRGNELFVNNVPVQLRSVCRHEVHPLRGRSLPPGQWRKDIEIFRASNLNHIRTSHYPPGEELLAAADELGMFIEDEGPFCWAHGAGKDSPEIRRATVRQLLELVERDRSHPSVLFWSLGNESRWSESFAVASQAMRELDPTRPQTFNFFPWGGGTNKPDEGYCEIGSDHYPGPGGPPKYNDFKRPVSYGEYAHLNAYNRHELVTDPGVRDAWGRGMNKMWQAMWASKGTLGGSLWAGVDDSFFIPDGRTVGYGTWGPIDGWRRPKPEQWHTKKAYSPVRLLTKELDPKQPGLKIENRFDVTNINELKIEWSKDGKAWQTLTTEGVSIPARTEGTLKVPAETLGLRFTSPLGFVIDQYCVRPEKSTLGASTVPLTGTVNEKTGQLAATVDGTPVITGGPHLMVLAINGAGGTQMSGVEPNYPPHTAPCSDWKGAPVRKEGASYIIAGEYKEAKGEFVVTPQKDGTLKITYAFTMKTNVNPRQVGFVFDLPKSFDTLAWHRKGLWSYYPEDHIGRLQGTTQAFDGMHQCGPAGPRVKPSWPWCKDGNDLGSNDFRSTKENIFSASLTNTQGAGLTVLSDARQHVRAWVEGEKVRLLVADYNNPGGERFFRRHAKLEDKPLKKGDKIQGAVTLRGAKMK